MTFQTSAPTRIDLAGGTIDIWPLYLFHNKAQTINVAINLRAHAKIEKRDDNRIVIQSKDLNKTAEFKDKTELFYSKKLRLLTLLTSWFLKNPKSNSKKSKLGFTLTTSCDSPAGAGIAGSSALAVAVSSALAKWTEWDCAPEKIIEIAMNIEAMVIGVPTGLQDYRPAMYGGVAAIELEANGSNRVPLNVNTNELERRIVLCYTGEPRNSGTNNWEITKQHLDGNKIIFNHFERIRDIALVMREALECADWNTVGLTIADEWENRKQLAPGVTTNAIDDLIDKAKAAGALGAKVCGAGGGGCLFCYAQPETIPAVRKALTSNGAQLLQFKIDNQGLLSNQ
jgi:D-glycero-alpha-D-manno-heptose-7-phosphate kinase